MNTLLLKRGIKAYNSHLCHLRLQHAVGCYLQQLVSILQSCLVGDATSCHFGDKDPSVLPADNGDAKRLRTFVHNDVAWLLQVWPDGREGNE